MTTGIVFDIHHYAVHDGPGIRTLVFLKGCPLSCVWCCNPESRSPQPTLMHSDWRCTACGNCLQACPNGAVHLTSEEPVFAREACGTCEDWPCLHRCPQEAITKAGTQMEARTVVARIAKDIPYYLNSGGGATFSGGEPFTQAAFLLELLQGCHAQGIHTAVETCGYARPEDIRAAEPLVDLFLFDLKVLNPQRHLEATGMNHDLILENLAWLASQAPRKVIIRLALIPELTDGLNNLSAIADLMQKLGLEEINLEPFHPMGIDKYRSSGRTYSGPVQPEPGYFSSVESACAYFTAQGLRCEIV